MVILIEEKLSPRIYGATGYTVPYKQLRVISDTFFRKCYTYLFVLSLIQLGM